MGLTVSPSIPADDKTDHARSGSYFSAARDFTLNNPAMTSIRGDNNCVTHVNVDVNNVPHSR
jgi:hypothetical protein